MPRLALPAPTARDFEVYRKVVIKRGTTRQAAAEEELSQTRVCQIVKRVAEFLADVAPGAEDEEETRRQRLFTAEQVASERMAEMFGELYEAWRDSKGIATTWRSVEGVAVPLQMRVEHKRTTQGDTKYVTAAMRAAREAGKFPHSMMEMLAGEGREIERERGEEATTDVEHVPAAPASVQDSNESSEDPIAAVVPRSNSSPRPNPRPSSPPHEDCSRTIVPEVVTTTAAPEAEHVTFDAQSVYDSKGTAAASLKSALFKTVQGNPDMLAQLMEIQERCAGSEPPRDHVETLAERKRRKKLSVLTLQDLEQRLREIRRASDANSAASS